VLNLRVEAHSVDVDELGHEGVIFVGFVSDGNRWR
jgi:hypothetical protein